MSELPQSWVEASIEEIVVLNPKLSRAIANDTAISFVPMAAINEKSGEIDAAVTRPFSEVSKGYTRFQTGDVIFAKITPCMENGKSAVARQLTGDIACGSTEFHVLRPEQDILPDYVWRFLRQKTFRANAEQSMTGAVGQRRVPLDYLRATSIPLAPAVEQRRIEAKIDSLSGKSGRARDHLDHIPRLVEKYKQAILAVFFSAKLTSTDKSDAPIDLDVVASDKRQLLSNLDLRPWNGEAIDKKSLRTLPDGWDWLRIGDVVAHRSGALRVRHSANRACR